MYSPYLSQTAINPASSLVISYLDGELVKTEFSRNVETRLAHCGSESADVDYFHDSSCLSGFRSIGLKKSFCAFVGDDSAV
jgi:hypothetical protein